MENAVLAGKQKADGLILLGAILAFVKCITIAPGWKEIIHFALGPE